MPNLKTLNLPIKNEQTGTTTKVRYDIPQGDVMTEDLEEYAKVNGYYDELTAGSAEQLLSSQFVEDSVPYKFRTSGGSADIGNREYDEIVGGSIVWNQLFIPYPKTYQGLTITDNEDGTITLNGTITANVVSCSRAILNVRNHKLLFLNNAGLRLYTGYGNAPTGSGSIINHTWEDNASIFIWGIQNQTFNNVKVTVQAFDLTQMFGSTVADYIYSLEQAQSGKGVAFFKSLFPNDYYPYDEGELMSVEGLQSHDTVGFNQWDEEWELGRLGYNSTDANWGQNVADSNRIRSKNYIPIFPNTVYYCYGGVSGDINCVFYDSEKNPVLTTANIGYATIKNSTFTTPSNACYMRFYVNSQTTYNNDICINLSWSGWRNGEYEPYKKHSYALDSSLTLRGFLKLSSQNELYFDGDIYSYDGKVQRRYGVVDLGSLSWSYYTGGTNPIFSANLTTSVKGADGKIPNIITSKYVTAVSHSRTLLTQTLNDKEISLENNYGVIHLRDTAYTDVTTFKTAMSGVYLIYELATPTEETAEPFDEIQLVDDFGTEEYVSGNLVPVGHNTKYPANLRDKLQHLPNLADSDGYYMISQQNKQMSLELFRIPKAPTTDGTYILKATVSGGTPTYVWESEETE